MTVLNSCTLIFLGPVWEGGQKDEDSSLHTAMYNSLSECHSRLLTSVSVPAISSGIFGFPKARCAKILFSAALESFRSEPNSSVQLVRFTNFDSWPPWTCSGKLPLTLMMSPMLESSLVRYHDVLFIYFSAC